MVEIVITLVAVFVGGSVLMLERRCLGQMAVVQPLVVCLIAGWLVDNVELGIWLGVSLQLFSLSPLRRFDWALTGVVAALSLILTTRYGMVHRMGCLSSLALLLVAVIVGVLARLLDRRYARIDGEAIRKSPPLMKEDAISAIESHVYKVIARYFVVGGVETVIGTAIAVAMVFGIGIFEPEIHADRGIFATLVPILGAAVALSSLAELRFFVWTGISALVMLVGVLL